MHSNRLRGHEIRLTASGYVYADTGERVDQTWQSRPCGHCGRDNTPEGHDGCLGSLAGVVNACCGHGEPEESYVVFSDGLRLAGREAMLFFESEGQL